MSWRNNDWQNASNPNMAPLAPRQGPPRMGFGAAPPPVGGPPPVYSGPPPMVPGASPPGVMGTASPSGPAPPGLAPPPPGASPPGGAQMAGWAQRSQAIASGGGPELATTLFVGSISPGVGDRWLTQLLEACGPLRNLKRVNKAFGFAEYVEPDSVLRALAVLNGQELPAMGSEAGNASAAKKLVLKADEKTKTFLASYEDGRIKTDADDQAELASTSRVAAILAQMRDPAVANMEEARPAYDVPAHLKDLPPEELPEEHRGSVLSEIDKFRQASAAREEEKKRRERVQEMERMRAKREEGPSAGAGHDPQSYRQPVSFVAATSSATAARELTSEEADEEEEKRRLAKVDEERRRAADDAERRCVATERRRLAHWEKQLDVERADEDRRRRIASTLRARLEAWDDERERNKEPFYLDRGRWRSYRTTARQREMEEDEEDREREAAEAKKAAEDAERFLAQQAADVAALAEQQRAAGMLIAGQGTHAPLKLKVAAPEAGAAAQPAPAAPGKAAVALGEVEDESEALRRGKVRRIELDDGLTEEEKAERRRKRAQKVAEGLPKERGDLFAVGPRWEWLDQSTISTKYRKAIDQEISASVGEEVAELSEAFVEALGSSPSAADLVEVLEPVLAEEAGPIVERIWRTLLIDTLSASASSSA